MAGKDGVMTHDPRDIETVARLLCEAAGANPDLPSHEDPDGPPNWHLDKPWALGVLEALQDKGWKITSGKAAKDMALWHGDYGERLIWLEMHDAAPICPQEDKG